MVSHESFATLVKVLYSVLRVSKKNVRFWLFCIDMATNIIYHYVSLMPHKKQEILKQSCKDLFILAEKYQFYD